MSDKTIEGLSEIMPAEWQSGPSGYTSTFESRSENATSALPVEVHYMLTAPNRHRDVWIATVMADGPNADLYACEQGESEAEALRVLMERWGDVIEEFAGIIEPGGTG